MKLDSKSISLRLVEESDAEFIVGLRTDEKYSKYLSQVTDDVSAQVAWIRGYKLEEALGKQFYFIIERHDGVRCGTVRVYDLQPESFSWGSWILNVNKTKSAALESAFLVYKFGFDVLGFKKSHFEVMRGNEAVAGFHEKMGARKISEDNVSYFFEIDQLDVLRKKEKFKSKLQ